MDNPLRLSGDRIASYAHPRNDNTLALNAATRHGLLTHSVQEQISTCNSEAIFNAGMALTSHPRQLAVATLGIYSSSSTLLLIGL